jgi:hypothetical protein
MTMDKRALEIDPNVVKRFALGGAITGGSAAALVNLIRMIRQLNEERKAAREPDETSEHTIHLTLPRKMAEVKNDPKDPSKVRKVEVTRVTVARGPGKQFRRACDGTFGMKTAAGWPTLTTAALAAMGSAAAGAAVVNRIYERRREKQLEAELDAAKQEYLDMLQGGQGKMAEALDQLFGSVLFEKEGQVGGRTFGTLSYPLAFMALLSVMGTGGTAYLTKKILDEKLRQAKEKGLDTPRVRRIVFRSAPPMLGEGDEEEEEAKVAEADEEAIRASLGVMLDKVGHQTLVLDTPYVKEAMERAGTTIIGLFKMGQDIDELRAYLEGNPELRKMIQRATMEKHPILRHFKWSLKLPFIGPRADKKLMSRFDELFQKEVDPVELETPSGFGGGYGAGTGQGTRLGLRGKALKSAQASPGMLAKHNPAVNPKLPPPKENKLGAKTPEQKAMEAGSAKGAVGESNVYKSLKGLKYAVDLGLSPASVIASTVGSTIADKASTENLAKAIVAAQQKAQAPEQEGPSPEELASSVELEAADPEAKEYLEQNRERVLAILRQLAKAEQV